MFQIVHFQKILEGQCLNIIRLSAPLYILLDTHITHCFAAWQQFPRLRSGFAAKCRVKLNKVIMNMDSHVSIPINISY